MNPPPSLVKLCGWNAVRTSAKIVMTGIAIFHHTAILLVSDSHLTPITLMIEKSSISPAATR